MASDWIKSKRITIGYSDDCAPKTETPSKEKTTPAPPAPPGSSSGGATAPAAPQKPPSPPRRANQNLAPIDILSEPTRLVSVIRKIAAK